LVLQQHNCLAVELPYDPGVDADDSPAVANEKMMKQRGLVYSINEDKVLNRLKFAKALHIAKTLFGEIGSLILEELICHGRLRIAQIRSDASTKLAKLLAASAAETTATDEDKESSTENGHADGEEKRKSDEELEEEARESEAEIQTVFEAMVQRRLIVPVTVLDVKVKRKDTDPKGINGKLTASSSSSAKGKKNGSAVEEGTKSKAKVTRGTKRSLSEANEVR
jgi:hypothetical protein